MAPETDPILAEIVRRLRRRGLSRPAGRRKGPQAFLAWHDVPFRKTHDLAEIGPQCAALDASLDPVAETRP